MDGGAAFILCLACFGIGFFLGDMAAFSSPPPPCEVVFRANHGEYRRALEVRGALVGTGYASQSELDAAENRFGCVDAMRVSDVGR